MRLILKIIEGWAVKKAVNQTLLMVIRIAIRMYCFMIQIIRPKSRFFLKNILFTTVTLIDSQEQNMTILGGLTRSLSPANNFLPVSLGFP